MARTKTAAPRPPRIGGPLDGVNDAFHANYDAARSSAEHEAPVLVVLADALIVCRAGRARTHRFAPTSFHAIKSAAHAPVAVYSALCDAPDGRLRPKTRRALERLAGFARESLASIHDGDEAVVADARSALRRTIAFVDRVRDGGLSRAALDLFARRSGAVLRRLTEHATRVQLAALHAGVEETVRALTRAERRALHVVVAGDHQARARSLAMQYFQKRFGEPPGAETRVTYGERVTSMEEARALVGTQRLDRAIARAFFGDAKRLQRDVLGDAAASILAQSKLAPIR